MEELKMKILRAIFVYEGDEPEHWTVGLKRFLIMVPLGIGFIYLVFYLKLYFF
ncbi:hypothetical protein ACMGE7_01995 [Macrococcus equi]|uniref:hypothetical protein n=1 Tax=Macrococcus equi TaxID=3395462 RepID=UPI0039BE3F0A